MTRNPRLLATDNLHLVKGRAAAGVLLLSAKEPKCQKATAKYSCEFDSTPIHGLSETSIHLPANIPYNRRDLFRRGVVAGLLGFDLIDGVHDGGMVTFEHGTDLCIADIHQRLDKVYRHLPGVDDVGALAGAQNLLNVKIEKPADLVNDMIGGGV